MSAAGVVVEPKDANILAPPPQATLIRRFATVKNVENGNKCSSWGIIRYIQMSFLNIPTWPVGLYKQMR